MADGTRNGLIFILLGIAKQPNMKKYFTLIFLGLFLALSSSTFAQVDSSRIASAQREIAKDQKRADKLAKRAKRQERKQKRHEKKMERKERKRQRALNNIEKSERKLDKMRRDTTGTSALLRGSTILPSTQEDTLTLSTGPVKLEGRKRRA
jgi:septal ring factor EnvC (AmiA/AmiB activator)